MKILCPYHDDTEPSMHLYASHAHCFVCWAHVPIDKLDLGKLGLKKLPQVKEDLDSKLSYIKNLPTKTIRGLELPYDDVGYYILWPQQRYYKCRKWNDTGGRYLSPKGITKPLYVIAGDNRDKLLIIEGELNAASLANITKRVSICSPGSAGEMLKYINFYLRFKSIHVIVDHDPAGVVYGLELKQALLARNKPTKLHTLTTDFNELLQHGKEKEIRDWFKKEILGVR